MPSKGARDLSFHRAAAPWADEGTGHLVPRCLATFLFSIKKEHNRGGTKMAV